MRNIFKNASIRNSILIPTVLIVMITLIASSYLTFVNYQSTAEELGETSSKEINKQIILNFENYIASVIDTADYIQQKTIELGLKNQNYFLEDVFTQAADVQTDIESIVLVDFAGREIVNSSFKDITDDDITQKDWYLDVISVDLIYHFSSPHQQDILKNSTAEVITVTKIIDYYVSGVKSSAILVIDINTSSIVQLTETTNLGEGGHIVILNDDDSLIYSDLQDCQTNQCESLSIARDVFRGQSVTINGLSMYVTANTLKDTRWVLATFINTELIEQTRRQNMIILGIISISTLAITLVVTSLIANGISKPINRLKDHMQLIESGDFYQSIEISGQKEVIVLAHSFNAMIEEIRSLMEKVLTEQKEKRKTEFQALQNQINPHFLYNTLDSIVYLSENKLNDKVVEMVVALSKFFRISISRGENIILLKEELEHARNYLLIQKIRYNEKFDFDFQVQDEVLTYKVVKLSLQPLIENAIYHGINTEYNSGMITIRAFLKDDRLILEVEDDGYGIPDEEIDNLYRSIKFGEVSNSIGLTNVYQRLKIYYGESFDFIIESELDEKTIFRLSIPKERAK
jgi:two-component system, sensor histidine kinase YesM